MVDLPLAPDRIVTSTAPQSSVSRSDIIGENDRMAGALAKVADTTMDIAAKQAKEQAAEDLLRQKVVRNDDGSVSTVNPASSVIFGRAGEQYQEAVKAGTIAQTGNVLSTALTEMHAEHSTDPAAFEKASDAFLDKFTADNRGSIGEAAVEHGRALQTQHTNAIITQAANLDIANQQKSIQASITDQKNTLQGLARTPGGPDTPEFKAANERLAASYQALGSNPLFKMPQGQIDLELKNFKELLQGEQVVAHVDDNFTKKGKAEAQAVLNRDILQNPNLSETDRNRLYVHGMARLQFLTADAKERIDAGRKVVGELEASIASGTIKPTDPIIGMEIKQAQDRGDGESANRILAATQMRAALNGISTLPQAVQDEVLGIKRSGAVNAAIPVEGRALLDHIAGTESGGRYDVRYGGQRFAGFDDHPRVAEPITSGPDAGKTTTAAGRYQFIGSTWDAQAKKLGLKDFSPESQDTAAWDLAQTEYKAKTGRDLLTTLKSGDQAAISDVPRQLSSQWSSLPGGRQPAGGGDRFVPNLAAADQALHLTPQERDLYQRHLTNLTGAGGVDNPDGSRSTLFQASVEHDGKTYNIPTVWDGKILPPAEAVKRAEAEGWGKFPSYKNEQEAEARYEQMHAFMEKDTGAYMQSRARARDIAPAANNGPPFTAADLARNPALGSAYIRTIAADESLRLQSATQAAAGVEKAVAMGFIPSPQDMALIGQTGQRYPEKFGPTAEKIQGLVNATALAQLEKPQRDLVLAQYRTAMDGQDQHHMNVAAAALDQYQKSEKNLADHPYQEAATRGWIEPVAPIDPGRPETVAAALAQRVAASQRIASMNHTAAPAVLDKDELPQMQAALEGPAGAEVLTRIATTLKPDDMNTMLGEKGFKDSLTNMMSSKDPVKMSAAMSVADKVWRDNPAEAEGNLGKGAITKLQAWQGLRGTFTAQELAERLNAADDPTTVKARKEAETAAESETDKLKPADIAYKFGTSWGIPILSSIANVVTGATPAVPFDSIKAGELKADYAATYTSLRTYGVDADKASELAVKRLESTWGISAAAGNQVMKNPPERSYPAIDGSHDWLKADLKAEITKDLGAEWGGIGRAGVTNWKIAGLEADGRTQAEIDGKQPPSYKVWVTRADGTLYQVPGRIAFDPSNHIAEHGAMLEQGRQSADFLRPGVNAGMPQP